MVRTCEPLSASEGESGDRGSRVGGVDSDSSGVENVRISSSPSSQTTANVRPDSGGTTSDQRWSSEQAALVGGVLRVCCRIVSKLWRTGRVGKKRQRKMVKEGV